MNQVDPRSFSFQMLAHRLRNVKPSPELSRDELLRGHKQYFVHQPTPTTTPFFGISSLTYDLLDPDAILATSGGGVAAPASRRGSRAPSASSIRSSGRNSETGLAPSGPRARASFRFRARHANAPSSTTVTSTSSISSASCVRSGRAKSAGSGLCRRQGWTQASSGNNTRQPSNSAARLQSANKNVRKTPTSRVKHSGKV